MDPGEPVSIAALPFSLRWLEPGRDLRVEGRSLELSAGPATDLFSDPEGDKPNASAPALIGAAPGDFLLGARVSVEFATTFDAGVLLLYRDERNWAKLCFELSPQKEPTVVSVVTRGVSDDCNSFAVQESEIWLRIARIGDCVAFHASKDGALWKLVRYFTLPAAAGARVGFLAQSPSGNGCRVRFSEIFFEARRLADLRSGA
ncbi:MAG: DUF1349 domain-containing protein [Gaiellaceae bacterium]|jgi:regulation of enolase protein 1 (concanavalin A-like superfamily)